jgi:hypothetical protein
MVTRAVAAGGAAWAFTISPPLALLAIAGGFTVTAYAGRPTPLALLGAALSMLLEFAVAPGTPVICET